MKNILLEKFSSSGIEAFERELEGLVDIKLVVFNGESFPVNDNIETLNSLSVTKGIDVDSCPWLLENSEMRYLSNYEGMFLSMLSRYDVYKKAFTSEEKLEHYYRLVNFWINKIKDIDVIFSLDVPHVPSSFALYIASKLLKTPFIYLDFAQVYNRFQFFGCSYRNRSILLESEEKQPEKVIAAYHSFKDAYILNSIDRVSPYIVYIETRVERFWWRKLAEDINSSLPVSLKALFEGKLKIRSFYTTELGWKISRRRWDDPKSGFIRPYLLIAKLIDRIKIHLAKKRYRAICEDSNILGEYILFAPPMEPEASILPTALESRFVFSALKLISEELPEGINIVYKENPDQFNQQFLFVTEWRNKFYYEDLKKIKNIIFVPENASTHNLVANSIGVATLNGTIATESLFAGKHCMTFASQWYDDFDGLHYVKTGEDISKAVKMMLSNEKPNPDPTQVNMAKNFVDMDGYNPSTYTKEDNNKICLGMWSSYHDFLELDDRKWDL
jgi:hypothetical protein